MVKPEPKHHPNKRDLIDGAGVATPVDAAAVDQRLKAGTFFWLDLTGPVQDDVALLRDVFHFHPSASGGAAGCKPPRQAQDFHSAAICARLCHLLHAGYAVVGRAFYTSAHRCFASCHGHAHHFEESLWLKAK